MEGGVGVRHIAVDELCLLNSYFQFKLRHPHVSPAQAMSSSCGLVATSSGSLAATKPWLGLVAQIVSSNVVCVPGGTDMFAMASAEHATFASENAGSTVKIYYGRLASKAAMTFRSPAHISPSEIPPITSH